MSSYLYVVAIFVCILVTYYIYSLTLSDNALSSNLSTPINGTITLYYAPWCGHCKHFMPEYDKFAGIAKTNNPSLLVNKVDCTKTECPKIRGYPTVFYEKDNITKEFHGARTSDALCSFVNNN